MNFTKLNIYTTSGDLEPLISRLEDLGASGFEIHDAADFEDFLASGVKHWDYVGDELEPLKTQETHITLYFTTDRQGEELLAAVRGACGSLRLEQSEVREEDWADSWKEYFKPFEVGERFIIKPTWEEMPGTDRLVLEIDPASAFGTGQHESTKLCLEMLERVIAPGCSFLDLGCGSGILTIGALLLGAGSAAMVDVSENAVKVANENLAQNGFTAAAYCGDMTRDKELLHKITEVLPAAARRFDAIAANIVADVIIEMSSIFQRLLTKDGVLITSGIIEARLDEVVAALESAGLHILETKTDNGWCLILAKPRLFA
ncbi:MAG: 50S ribosomal protein L11 methyltransferase [Oscillospiraceae bacterium]|nr:50S ribosomal protein L11 methyltransferase [Oscillospiraceae bacterium]